MTDPVTIVPAPLLDTKDGLPILALRSREAAPALGISARTLALWTANRLLPSVLVGGVRLYPLDGLRQFLAEQVKAQTDQVRT